MWTHIYCTSDLGLFYTTDSSVPPTICAESSSIKKCFASLMWMNLTGLHKVLTLTPSDTFGMNWIATGCRPDLDALLAECEQIPTAECQKVLESLPRRAEALIRASQCQTSKIIQYIVSNVVLSTYFWPYSAHMEILRVVQQYPRSKNKAYLWEYFLAKGVICRT